MCAIVHLLELFWKPLMLILENLVSLHARDNHHDNLKLLTYEH